MVIILLVFRSTLLLAQVSLDELRANIEKAKNEEDYTVMLCTQLEKTDLNIEQQGYYGLYKSILAEHVYSPIKKLGHFNEGKNRLELLIQNNQQNLELRYIRLILQLKAPSFLGYNGSIGKDKTYILRYLESNRKELGEIQFKRIVSFLKTETSLTNQEQQDLEKTISGK